MVSYVIKSICPDMNMDRQTDGQGDYLIPPPPKKNHPNNFICTVVSILQNN